MIITTAVIKGGTGKTTTAAALAQAAAADGKKVLAIDLDPQANLTFFIGADQTQPGSYELLHGEDPAELIQRSQGIDIIAGSPNLATERTTPASAMRLAEALKPLKRYSLIVIDTPPQMGELTYNALQAATGLLIPLETDNSSLQGLYQITDIAQQIRRNSNPKLNILGIVLTRYDSRPKLNRYLMETIAEKGSEIGAPLLMTIRPGIAIREAQAMQQSLYEYAPESNPAKDYKTLYERLMK